jgi:hypothetical protein
VKKWNTVFSGKLPSAFWFMGIFSILVVEKKNSERKSATWHDIELMHATALAKPLIDLYINSAHCKTNGHLQHSGGLL